MSFEEAQKNFEWTENLCYYRRRDDPMVDTEFCYTKVDDR